jgi:hypothetical protein
MQDYFVLHVAAKRSLATADARMFTPGQAA